MNDPDDDIIYIISSFQQARRSNNNVDEIYILIDNYVLYCCVSIYLCSCVSVLLERSICSTVRDLTIDEVRRTDNVRSVHIFLYQVYHGNRTGRKIIASHNIVEVPVPMAIS